MNKTEQAIVDWAAATLSAADAVPEPLRERIEQLRAELEAAENEAAELTREQRENAARLEKQAREAILADPITAASNPLLKTCTVRAGYLRVTFDHKALDALAEADPEKFGFLKGPKFRKETAVAPVVIVTLMPEDYLRTKIYEIGAPF